MPARAQHGKRCLLEHVSYMVYLSSGPGWGLQALTGSRDDAPFGSVIVIGGQVVGMWKRSAVKERLRIEPRWFNPPSRGEETAFTEAAERYAVFVGHRSDCRYVEEVINHHHLEHRANDDPYPRRPQERIFGED